MVCAPGSSEKEQAAAARRLVARPLLSDAALTVGEWMFTASRFADIRRSLEPGFYSQVELLNRLSQSNAPGGGREIIFNMLSATDGAIISQSIMSGDLAAYAAIDELNDAKFGSGNDSKDGATRQAAVCSLFSHNRYLADNSWTIYLRRASGMFLSDELFNKKYLLTLKKAQKQIDAVYAQFPNAGGAAMQLMYSASAKLPLEILFGLGAGIEVGSSPKLEVTAHPFRYFGCALESRKMPTPDVLAKGELSYPPEILQLFVLRSRLVERLLDYDFFNPLNNEERNALINPIVRSRL